MGKTSRQMREEYFRNGKEMPSQEPVFVATNLKRDSEIDRFRRFLRSEEMAKQARQQGFETFEEADDFDVGDDFDPTSPYEQIFEPVVEEVPSSDLIEGTKAEPSPGEADPSRGQAEPGEGGEADPKSQ